MLGEIFFHCGDNLGEYLPMIQYVFFDLDQRLFGQKHVEQWLAFFFRNASLLQRFFAAWRLKTGAAVNVFKRLLNLFLLLAQANAMRLFADEILLDSNHALPLKIVKQALKQFRRQFCRKLFAQFFFGNARFQRKLRMKFRQQFPDAFAYPAIMLRMNHLVLLAGANQRSLRNQAAQPVLNGRGRNGEHAGHVFRGKRNDTGVFGIQAENGVKRSAFKNSHSLNRRRRAFVLLRMRVQDFPAANRRDRRIAPDDVAVAR